jgi:hypothetical protein
VLLLFGLLNLPCIGLQAQKTLNNIEEGYYISPAFLDKITIHIAKNFLDLPKIKVPLILGEYTYLTCTLRRVRCIWLFHSLAKSLHSELFEVMVCSLALERPLSSSRTGHCWHVAAFSMPFHLKARSLSTSSDCILSFWHDFFDSLFGELI